jgi:hypothetical protein
MSKFTLTEIPAPGATPTDPPADQTFVPPESAVLPRRQKSVGDQMIILDRVLVDKNGHQVGSFVLHGTLLQIFVNEPNLDALMSFQASNTFAEGVINTQGVVRFRDFATGVTFAIVGGTGEFKKARGTVTVKTPEFTYRVA